MIITFFTCFNIFIASINAQCWKFSYGRGVGKIPTTCADGDELQAGLCYGICRTNFYGVGPVCWERCRSGYTDIGLRCTKAGDVYAKGSYGRGAGRIPTRCKPDEDYDAGLCYPKCNNGMSGVGRVCWGRCFEEVQTDCGGLLCTTGPSQCTTMLAGIALNISNIFANVGKLLAAKGKDIPSAIATAAEGLQLTSTMINDICDGSGRSPSMCILRTNQAKCFGLNGFNCGLFCTSSKVKCVKEIMGITGQVVGVLTPENKIKKPKAGSPQQIDQAQRFIDKFVKNVPRFIERVKSSLELYEFAKEFEFAF